MIKPHPPPPSKLTYIVALYYVTVLKYNVEKTEQILIKVGMC